MDWQCTICGYVHHGLEAIDHCPLCGATASFKALRALPAAPKAIYRLEVPDIAYYKRTIPCQVACPVKTDARGYVLSVASGQWEKGYAIAREPNPLASTCGMVCNAPCEDACRRGKIDRPIAIRALKRFLTNRYGVEAGVPEAAGLGDPLLPHGDALLGAEGPGNAETAYSVTAFQALAERERRPDGALPGANHKVAIIGSGPAGLACAHDLALLGYQVTIFEAASVPGGLLMLGVQDWRLPRAMVRLEVENVQRRGVAIQINTPIGPQLTLEDLRRQGYEAIFIGVGLMKGRLLRLEGVETPGVVTAMDIIMSKCRGEKVEVGERVIVVGGGAVATDAARLAVRQGAKEVRMMCLESREEMPAPDIEIEESLEEGVMVTTRVGPKRIITENGRVRGLETLVCASVFDEEGRFNPRLVPETEEIHATDMVILAVGQTSDLSFLKEEDGVKQGRPGILAADPETYATTAPGVFCGGDVAVGPTIIIEAEAHGHRAAISMHQYIQKQKVKAVTYATMTLVDPKDYQYPNYIQTRYLPAPVRPVEERYAEAVIPEIGYDEALAQREGQRCLQCHIQTVFNGDLCIMCNGCVDACPTYCLKMVRLSEVDGDDRLAQTIEARYGVPFARFKNADPDDPILNIGTIMLKDEDRCIRCGFCAEICPTGAVTMEEFHFEERLVPA